MIHDRAASTANLARSILSGLDVSSLDTKVQTATLKLLLETLIELSLPRGQIKLRDDAQKAVLGHTVKIGEAHKAQLDKNASDAARRY